MDAILSTVQGFLSQGGAGDSSFILLAAAAGFAFALGVSAFALGLLDPVRKRIDQVSASEEFRALSSAELDREAKTPRSAVKPEKRTGAQAR